jgi:uncharacterized membrane protein (UPF0127 family)
VRAWLAASVLLFAGGACGGGGAAPAGSWATAVLNDGTSFTLEVVDTPAARARGYMERAVVGPKEGMLFVFEEPGRHGFWMKNCRVSLDILWLDASFRVQEVAARQAPCPETGPCPSVVPMRPAHYGLELAAGAAAAHGLAPGARVSVFRGDGSPW